MLTCKISTFKGQMPGLQTGFDLIKSEPLMSFTLWNPSFWHMLDHERWLISTEWVNGQKYSKSWHLFTECHLSTPATSLEHLEKCFLSLLYLRPLFPTVLPFLRYEIAPLILVLQKSFCCIKKYNKKFSSEKNWSF